jgi:selenophosphate synthetase-related protein
VFIDAGLSAAKVGSIDTTGLLTVIAGSESRTVLDLNSQSVTGLTRDS